MYKMRFGICINCLNVLISMYIHNFEFRIYQIYSVIQLTHNLLICTVINYKCSK